MNLEEMRARRLELAQKARAILDVCDEEKRELSVEEERSYADLMARGEQLAARIDKEDRLLKLEEATERSHTEPTKPDVADAQPGQPRRFRSFGEQMQAVIRAAQPGTQVDNRLTVRTAGPTGMSETISSDGGFLVQSDFAAELLRRTYQTGQVANRCRRVQISGNSNGIKFNGVNETSRAAGSRWGGVLGYWQSEGADKSASAPKFRQIELNLKKLTGLCYATDELLADAGALETVMTQAFSEEFGFLLDDAIINGTGAGQPLGVLNAGCTVSVSKETGQAAKTIVYENIVNMWARIYNGSRTNAVWFVNQDVLPQLFAMSLAVGTGGVPVYLPASGAAGSPYSTLMGLPVVPVEQCATLGTVGDIILADMSQYVIADKGGIQSASSIHVRFTNDESVFRFVYRVDGMPMWNSVLTPFKGTANTVSPFVTLATRS